MAAMHPRWSPSDFLTNIDNSSCSITCVGYAPSQGRRCHQPIAAANRQDAAKLLVQMSRLSLSSKRLDGLLDQLAPRVLCKRYHQNQFSSMVSQWQNDIDDLREMEEARQARQAEQDRQAARRAEEARIAREAAQRAEDERREREATRQALESARREREAASAVQRTPTRRDNHPPTESRVPLTQTEQLASDLASMAARVAALEEQCQELRRLTRTQESVRSQAADHEAEEDTGGQTDQGSVDDYVTAPASPPSSDHGTEEEEEEPESHADPEIEGDCSICLEKLGDEDDLTLCKAQCGQRFHLDCVGIWLATDEHTRSCPCCRANWVD